MRMIVTVAGGSYLANKVVEVRNVKEGADKIIEAMERMPESMRGSKQVDWKRIKVEFER